MLKSSRPGKTPQGKAKKYYSYREAWARIKVAQEQGFYFEAVTLEESIISDRLISYLVGVGAIQRAATVEKYPSFGQLIKQWAQHSLPSVSEGMYADLPAAVDQWRIWRNKVVHGMVKSHPDGEPDEVTSFLEEAQRAAQQGAQLASAVCEWHKKIKKRHD
jgi:hypothetical protein